MTKIRKAVFPVAGLEPVFTRDNMPKELLPIVDKPLIQYAVEEAIAAGIDTLVFVTGRNNAIEDHFDANNELETMLRANGKDAQADMVRNIIPSGVECIFVRQAEQLGLGHAVLCAERAVGDVPFAVLLADDFLTDYKPGVTADLIAQFEKKGKSQLSVMKVESSEISKYGVVVPNGRGSAIGTIEKRNQLTHHPTWYQLEDMFDPDIFATLRELPSGSGGEIQLADALIFMPKSVWWRQCY